MQDKNGDFGRDPVCGEGGKANGAALFRREARPRVRGGRCAREVLKGG